MVRSTRETVERLRPNKFLTLAPLRESVQRTLTTLYTFPLLSLPHSQHPLLSVPSEKAISLIFLISKHPTQPKDQPVPAAAVVADHTPAVDHTADAAEDQEVEAAAHSHAATCSAVGPSAVVHIAGFGLAGEKSIGFEGLGPRVVRWACRRKLDCRNSFAAVAGAVDAVGRTAGGLAGVEVVGDRSFVVGAACRVMAKVACRSLELRVARLQGCNCCMSAVVAVA